MLTVSVTHPSEPTSPKERMLHESKHPDEFEWVPSFPSQHAVSLGLGRRAGQICYERVHAGQSRQVD